MNKWKILAVFSFLISFQALFADAVTDSIDRSRLSYRKGYWFSSIQDSLSASGQIAQKSADMILLAMPDPSNWTLAETNVFFNLSSANGSVDFNILAEKVYSNAIQTLQISVDTSAITLERYNNLLSSWDYLGDKGRNKKIPLVERRNTNFALFDGNTLYLPVQTVSSNPVGFLVKMELESVSNLRAQEREKTLVETAKFWISAFRWKPLQTLMK